MARYNYIVEIGISIYGGDFQTSYVYAMGDCKDVATTKAMVQIAEEGTSLEDCFRVEAITKITNDETLAIQGGLYTNEGIIKRRKAEAKESPHPFPDCFNPDDSLLSASADDDKTRRDEIMKAAESGKVVRLI